MAKRKTPKPAQEQTKGRTPKIMIAIPAGDQCMTLWAQSLVGLMATPDVCYDFAIGSLVYDARNQLSLAAVQEDMDLLLWTDTDMIFPRDALEKLATTMAQTGADVVTSICTTRKLPIEPVIYSRLDYEKNEADGTVKVHKEVYKDYPRDSVFEVAGCGFGFCLTRVGIWKRIWDELGQPFAPLPAFGEDLSACIRIRELGGKIVCDSRVKVQHIGLFPIGEEYLDD